MSMPAHITNRSLGNTMTNCLLRRSLIAAIITLMAGGVATASAAVDYGSPVSIGFGAHPVLRPAIHLTVGSQDSGTKRFSAKGTFTIGKHTVAHLASFHGTATTSDTSITVKVSTLERHMIRAAARRYDTKRVSLTITTTVDLPGAPSDRSSAFLAIPSK